MRIAIHAKLALMILLLLTTCLTVASVGTVILTRIIENRYTLELLELFWVDNEGNFPAFFSALLLLTIAILLGFIGVGAKQCQEKWWKHWATLAGILFFLTVDEAIQIHERFDKDSLLFFMETQGLLAWPWVIPYSILVALVIVGFYKFWWSLPEPHRWRFAACAGVYVFAAIGLEMVGAMAYTQYGKWNPPYIYIMLVTIEEALEMIAAAFSIAVLISYMSEHYPDLHIVFQKKA